MFVKHAMYDPHECFVYVENNNTCRIVFDDTGAEIKCQYDYNKQIMTILMTIGSSTMPVRVNLKNDNNIVDITEVSFSKFENYRTTDDNNYIILIVKNNEKGPLSIGYGVKDNNEFILNVGYTTDESVITGFFTFDISSDNS